MAVDRDEQVRYWWLTCDGCGHIGEVYISLEDLRDAIIDGAVYCRECGLVRELKPAWRGK